MKGLTKILLAMCIGATVLPSAAFAQAELEILRGIDRTSQAVGARERSRERARERLRNQRAQEQRVREHQEYLKQHPGSFPRQRYSHEAELNNNPWARANREKLTGEKEIRVELFVTENCADCKRLERWLNEVGVLYALYTLKPGTEADEKYQAQVGRGRIPALKINNRIVRGFDPDAARRAILEEKGDIAPEENVR